MIVKICSGRNSAPIRCVSRRGRFPSRSGAKDGGRCLRSGRSAAGNPGRQVSSSDAFGRRIPFRSGSFRTVPPPRLQKPLRFRCGPSRPRRGPSRFRSGAFRPAPPRDRRLSSRPHCPPRCLRRPSFRPCGPFFPPERQRRGTATTPLRGLRRTGSLFSSFRRIFGFRMSKLRIFPQTPPFPHRNFPCFFRRVRRPGCVPIVFFRIFVRRKNAKTDFYAKTIVRIRCRVRLSGRRRPAGNLFQSGDSGRPARSQRHPRRRDLLCLRNLFGVGAFLSALHFA